MGSGNLKIEVKQGVEWSAEFLVNPRDAFSKLFEMIVVKKGQLFTKISN